MMKTKFCFGIVIICAVLFTSCSSLPQLQVEKRKYRSGYNVQIKMPEKQRIVNSKQQEYEPELVTTINPQATSAEKDVTEAIKHQTAIISRQTEPDVISRTVKKENCSYVEVSKIEESSPVVDLVTTRKLEEKKCVVKEKNSQNLFSSFFASQNMKLFSKMAKADRGGGGGDVDNNGLKYLMIWFLCLLGGLLFNVLAYKIIYTATTSAIYLLTLSVACYIIGLIFFVLWLIEISK